MERVKFLREEGSVQKGRTRLTKEGDALKNSSPGQKSEDDLISTDEMYAESTVIIIDEKNKEVILSLIEKTLSASLTRMGKEEEVSLPTRVSVGHPRRKLLIFNLNGLLIDVVFLV